MHKRRNALDQTYLTTNAQNINKHTNIQTQAVECYLMTCIGTSRKATQLDEYWNSSKSNGTRHVVSNVSLG